MITEEVKQGTVDGKKAMIIKGSGNHYGRIIPGKPQQTFTKRHRQAGMAYAAKKTGKMYAKPSVPRIL